MIWPAAMALFWSIAAFAQGLPGAGVFLGAVAVAVTVSGIRRGDLL
jgi:hypothetical protein